MDRQVTSRMRLERKQVDDVMDGEDSWKNVDNTEATCPKCDNARAYYMQLQIRSADEPTNSSSPMGETFGLIADSPIQFFFSRYAISMVLMVIITNRIQHVCTPYGRPARISQLQRTLLRLPGILLLAYALYGLLQGICADQHTPSAQLWLRYLRKFVPEPRDPARLSATSLFWTAFLGVCVAQCIGTAVRSLELIGSRDDPSTFNLVSFGFILYIHSTTREFAPNAHVFLLVIAKVIELLGMNILLCRKPPLISRLAFTTMIGICIMVHYLFTMYYTDEYPIIHSASQMMETSVFGIVLLTIGLHALRMYFVDGSIDLRRLKLPPSSLPRATDDFSLAVLKLGTTCLHATQLTGLSCEIKEVDAPLHTYVELYPDGSTVVENTIEDYEQMERHGINGLGKEIKDVRVALDHSTVEIGGIVRGADKMRETWKFISTFLDIVYGIASRIAQRLPEPPEYLANLPRYIRIFWHGTNGEAEREVRLAQEEEARQQHQITKQRIHTIQQRQEDRRRHIQTTSAYERLELARRPSELEEDDLNPLELVALAQLTQGDGSELQGFQDVLVKHMTRPDNAPPLTRQEYKQIAAQIQHRQASMSTSLASSPVSHLSSAMLYSLSSRQASSESDRQTQKALIQLLQERRAVLASSSEQLDRERARCCVVCCSEERSVICWPCRCLALCNACRQTLASQQHALLSLGTSTARSVQLCPTCRAPIMAYSRLYLP
ncbi:hypothetical protein MVES1_003799 [Malassezia vespertilionis]|uniref:TFIIS-type domain-containing protein n=1 Tax=Malassezia vespertilionis TaxID=2020962 RepID=A0A2N1J7J3_9BASI|nr:uncharacterized protein MVES1_003799 [Malassezia vespertilionis]PKI82520.1 hypothetical protein MVES_003357 [Malassezia vespertilionis]WFD08424.1 hypothetical protein MVES1_003799 [Malassezia vespertilionis]